MNLVTIVNTRAFERWFSVSLLAIMALSFPLLVIDGNLIGLFGIICGVYIAAAAMEEETSRPIINTHRNEVRK